MTVAVAWALQTADVSSWPVGGGSVWRSVLALALVAALLAVFVWLVRRGTFGPVTGRRRGGLMTVESAMPLGERRSLVVVTVEGRRLLLGLTPMQVSLVTELRAAPAGGFADALAERVGARPENVS